MLGFRPPPANAFGRRLVTNVVTREQCTREVAVTGFFSYDENELPFSPVKTL